MLEIQVIGKKYAVMPLEAKQFPEKQFIQSLLNPDTDLVQEITAKEYQEFLENCKKNLEKL